MATTVQNFLKGRMNKALDKRIIPEGEYLDALNIRLGSNSISDIGSIENSDGNTKLVDLEFNNIAFGSNAICIGAYEDGANETIYWFVHQPSGFIQSATGKLDAIVSYNALTGTTTYHVVSCDDGGGVNTTLNFSDRYLVNGVDLVDDLLFFTDNYNPPRRINVKKSYPQPNTSTYVDDPITYDDILVIKAPPIEAPAIAPSLISGEENYLEERLICFAYRYLYAEDEYSATSAWSKPAFAPRTFSLDNTSFLNAGMVNYNNHCTISFNSGDSLVKGIDLLFKDMATNTIRVIEKLDKAEESYSDNTTYNYSFTNSKIYTVLPDTEILRLYDNVPLLAKAQTTMGNRLMYGNYTEGWDIKDSNGNPVYLDYQTSEVKEDIGFTNLTTTLGTAGYSYGPAVVVITDGRLIVDFSSVNTILEAGSSFTLELQFNHDSFANDGMTNVPTQQTAGASVTWTYVLPQSYSSVTEMVQAPAFASFVGTASNIQTDPANYCTGTTLTDVFNCALLDALVGGVPSPVDKYLSGIDAASEPVEIGHTSGQDTVSFTFPAMRYVDNTTTPTLGVYEYLNINPLDVTFQREENTESLHSNRGYQVGIMYMDKFSRSTTVLTSNNNTAFFACGDSPTKNSIRVTIPPSQVAPYFATRYKFAIKPDAETYDTIYSSIYFYDPATAHHFFLVEGENAAKAQEGTRLIVKKDVDGPLLRCEYATVLDKTVEQKDFILEDDDAYVVPQGVYLKIKVEGFNATLPANAVINPGTQTLISEIDGNAPTLAYTGLSGEPDGSGNYQTIDIPAGSKITYKFVFTRLGRGDGDASTCGRRIYEIEKTFTASADYADIIDWFNGDGIQYSLDDGTATIGGGGPDFVHVYNDTTATSANNNYGGNAYKTSDVLWYRWYKDTVGGTNEIRFISIATPACGSSDKKRSKSEITWSVVRADDLVVFETEPIDAAADIWYESSASYAIDANGNHSGNVTNQNISTGIAGVVDTEFFNCYAFGNGIESYKIRASLSGRALTLGNRVTSVSAQDFREAHRRSDITYSGIYNNETNVNRLNEFNLGNVNFKAMEESFGPIEVLFGRETDILCLQEDKISYVLTGKNLLSDSTGGGAVASVPEVLGTQIARVEEYGISNNPESFVRYGPDSFFTDAKRGAVINLRGSSSQEQLEVISEQGMRSWFRDMFLANFNTQKLGGFDPYMNEYVLANKTTLLPALDEASECGLNRNFLVSSGSSSTFSVAFGTGVGVVTYSFFLPSPSPSAITFNVDGIDYGPYTASGSFTVSSGVTNTESEVIISSDGDATNVNLTVSCPAQQPIEVILVTLNTDGDQGKTITNQYSFTEGTYVSPIAENPVTVSYLTGLLIGGFLSDYQAVSGVQGIGATPTDGSTVNVGSNQTSTDTLVWNTNNKFRWLASNTLYEANSTDIQSLVQASTIFTPTQTATQPIVGNFTAPANLNTYSYLYLIWDYRVPNIVNLCYSATSEADACCNCSCAAGSGSTIRVQNTGNSQVTFQYTSCARTIVNVNLAAFDTTEVCVDGNTVVVTQGDASAVIQSVISCDCCP